MRKMRLLYISLLAAFIACVTPMMAFAASAEDDAKAAYAAWDAAFNKGDAKAVAAFYAEDAVFLPATHDIINGPAGVEKFFAGIFGMGVKAHKLELIQVQGEGNMVVAAAKWSAAGKDANGADQPWGGIATHVFERQADGGLKLKLHTFN